MNCDSLHLPSPDLAQGSVPTGSRRPFPRHLDLGEKVTAGVRTAFAVVTVPHGQLWDKASGPLL